MAVGEAGQAPPLKSSLGALGGFRGVQQILRMGQKKSMMDFPEDPRVFSAAARLLQAMQVWNLEPGALECLPASCLRLWAVFQRSEMG